MKKVIEDILEEEKKARERLDQARNLSREMRKGAEEKAKQLLVDARADSLQEAKAVVDKAEQEAHKDREKRLGQTRNESTSMWDEKKEKIDETVEVLTRMILDGDGD